MLKIVRSNADETESGAARVFTFFRDRLLAGELKAGDRLLAERELALALGVSRPVLREPAITAHLVDAHREVFLSLARRDPDAAERRLREHFLIGDDLRRKNLISTYQPQEKHS